MALWGTPCLVAELDVSLVVSLDAFQGTWVPRDTYGEGSPATVPPPLLLIPVKGQGWRPAASPPLFLSPLLPAGPPKGGMGFIWPRCRADVRNYR